MIPAVKLTVCFVALAVLAGGAFATPTPESNLFFAEHSPTSEIVKSPFRTLAGNAEWILGHLATIVRTTVHENFLNAASWFMDIVTRMEFLVMADGSHFMFPACGQPDEEREHGEIARTVSKLLFNLKTMERTDEVIRNVTKTALQANAIDQSNWSWEKIMSAFLSTYFETMDRLFEEDEVLAVEYKRQKAEAKKEAKPNPRMHEALFKVWQYKTSRPPVVGKEAIVEFLRDKEIVRQAYANKMFMKEAVKNIAMIFNKKHYERYSMARALIKKAGESSDFESKVNQVYQKALFRAGGVSYMLAKDDVILEVLFDAIQKGVEADPTLHQEIRASMKQIESSTVYDSEMLYFDFSPL